MQFHILHQTALEIYLECNNFPEKGKFNKWIQVKKLVECPYLSNPQECSFPFVMLSIKWHNKDTLIYAWYICMIFMGVTGIHLSMFDTLRAMNYHISRKGWRIPFHFQYGKDLISAVLWTHWSHFIYLFL